MMTWLVLILTAIVIQVTTALPSPETYKGRFDNIDVDDVLNNERLYKSYISCFKGAGKCTPDGEEIKRIIPEALSTNCQKCTAEHKAKADHVLKFVVEKKQEDWKELEKIYDPTCQYRKKNKEEYAKKGINLGDCPS